MAEIHSTTTYAPSFLTNVGAQLVFKMALVVAIVAVDFAWIAGTDFEFDMASAGKVAAIAAVLAAIGWFYRAKRPMQRFEILCVETSALLAFSASAAVLSSLLTSLNRPLVDDAMMAFDSAVGFDWLSYVGFVNERPWLGMLSSAVYVTTLTQVALTVIVLGLIGKTTRVQQFVWAVMLGALICIAISALWPSAGALGTIRPPAEFISLNSPIVDLDYKQAFFDLRDGEGRYLSLDEPHGLIAFPSYHCTLSALIILAFAGVRFWFWPVFVLNLAVILSTPVDGGHHLADAIGGVIVALLAWTLAAKLVDTCSIKDRHRPA